MNSDVQFCRITEPKKHTHTHRHTHTVSLYNFYRAKKLRKKHQQLKITQYRNPATKITQFVSALRHLQEAGRRRRRSKKSDARDSPREQGDDLGCGGGQTGGACSSVMLASSYRQNFPTFIVIRGMNDYEVQNPNSHLLPSLCSLSLLFASLLCCCCLLLCVSLKEQLLLFSNPQRLLPS